MSIIDCFIFSDELDLLEIRLNELDSVVDRFVIVEGTTTFSGQPKPLHFAEHAARYRRFAHKIERIVVDDFPADVPSRWQREHWQRNAIVRGLGSLRANDVVLIGDADEIPSADAVRLLAGLDRRVTLRLGLYYYYFNCRSRLPWYGTVASPLHLVDAPQRMRDARETYPLLGDGKESGWHFSYLGGAEAVRAKIESFSHAEYDATEIKALDRLEARIAASEDLFDRPAYAHSFYSVPIDERLPTYVCLHRQELASFIRTEPNGQFGAARPDDAFCPDQLLLDVTFVLGAADEGATAVASALEARGLRFRPISGGRDDNIADGEAARLNDGLLASGGLSDPTGQTEVAMHSAYGRYPAGLLGITGPGFLATVGLWAAHVTAARAVGVFTRPPGDPIALERWMRDNQRLLRLRESIPFPMIDADGPADEAQRKLDAIADDLGLATSGTYASFVARDVTADAPPEAQAVHLALRAYAATDPRCVAIDKGQLGGAARSAAEVGRARRIAVPTEAAVVPLYDTASLAPSWIRELQELWAQRDLIQELVARDLKTRYKRSVLGIAWTMLNPLLMMAVLTFVFSNVFRFQIDHFAVYVLSALIVWNFFSQATVSAMTQLRWASVLIDRVHVPKTVFAVSAVGTGVVNLVLSMVPLAIIMLITGVAITPALVTLPIPIVLVSAFTLGLGLILSATAIYFADVAEMYQILLTAWYFFTPIMYPATILPEPYRAALLLNPMTVLVDIFRLPIQNGTLPPAGEFFVAAILSALVLVIGWLVFTWRADRMSYRL